MTLNFENKTKFAGDFVLKSQETAGSSGFSKVSQIWYDKTLSYEQGLNKLAKDKESRVDLMLSPKSFNLKVENKQIVLEHDGATYTLTNHALNGLCRLATKSRSTGMPGTGIISAMTDAELRYIIKPVKVTSPKDSTVLYELFLNYLQAAQSELREKKYRVRTQGNAVRAFLSDEYKPIDNEWFVKTLAELIPSGRLSHFNFASADTIYGNILIPDTILAEEDSDYGGMLSISNCEIGLRRAEILPSIFRAICMNGCIWDMKKGSYFSMVHRGEPNLSEIKDKMNAHIRANIALIPDYKVRMLAARQWELSVNPLQLFAEITEQLKLSATEGRRMCDEWKDNEGAEKTAWHVLNGVTRACQSYHPDDWVAVDKFIGTIMLNESKWERLQSRAKSQTKESILKLVNLGA